jgi:preprotein translocase subunit SecG
MTTFLTIVHIFLCLFLIGVVLLQSGRAGGMGVLSGAASQQVFGGRGAGNFLQRVTGVVAFMFLLTCATLGYLATSTRDRGLATTSAPAPGSTTVTVGGQRDGGAAAEASAPATAPTPTPAPTEPAASSDGGAAAEPAVPSSSGDAGAAPAEAPAPAAGEEAGVRA